MIRRLWESLFPPLSDFGIPDENGTTLTEYGETAERAKVRECRSDSWDAHVDSALAVANSPWLLTEEDLFGLTARMDLAPARPHEGTAAERGWVA